MGLVTPKTKYLEGWNFQSYPRTSGKGKGRAGAAEETIKILKQQDSMRFRVCEQIRGAERVAHLRRRGSSALFSHTFPVPPAAPEIDPFILN